MAYSYFKKPKNKGYVMIQNLVKQYKNLAQYFTYKEISAMTGMTPSRTWRQLNDLTSITASDLDNLISRKLIESPRYIEIVKVRFYDS